MVIDKDFSEPLIPKDDINNLESYYENFMCLSNEFVINLKENPENEKNEKIFNFLFKNIKKIDKSIKNLFEKENDNYLEKIKLISFNISNKCDELIKKIQNKEDFNNKNSFLNKANELKEITKEINSIVSRKILKITNDFLTTKKIEESNNNNNVNNNENNNNINNKMKGEFILIIFCIFCTMLLGYFILFK
jgi:hypothetical protein